jgi:hypothetical protein
MRVLVHEWQTLSGPLGEEIRKLMWEYVALVIRTFRRLSPDKSSQELRAAAFGLFGMLTWVDQWYRPERDLPMEVLADQFSEIFLQGFFSGGGQAPSADETEEKEEEAAAEAWAKLSSSFAILSGPGF